MAEPTMLVTKFLLLALLWLFIAWALTTLGRDTSRNSGVGPAGGMSPAGYGPGSGYGAGYGPQGQNEPRRRFALPKFSNKPKQLQLTVVAGPATGLTLDLFQQETALLGRARNCDMVLNDAVTSSNHARLIRNGVDWYIEDLDSKNGTVVNGYQIQQPELVGPGAEIRIGANTLRILEP